MISSLSDCCSVLDVLLTFLQAQLLEHFQCYAPTSVPADIKKFIFALSLEINLLYTSVSVHTVVAMLINSCNFCYFLLSGDLDERCSPV